MIGKGIRRKALKRNKRALAQLEHVDKFELSSASSTDSEPSDSSSEDDSDDNNHKPKKAATLMLKR